MHPMLRRAAAGTAVAAGTYGLLVNRSQLTAACEPYRQQALQLLPTPGPTKLVDTALAGLGLWGNCSVLGLLEPKLGVRLFAPPMMASGIIFFAAPTPPHPKGFLTGTLCSATLSLGVLALLSPIAPPVVAQGAAAGTLLMWYKLTGAMFPPAAVLAGLITAASVGTAAASPLGLSLGASASYLCFPWLAGHAWLYGCAHAVSEARSKARVAMSKRELGSLAECTDASLRATFSKFDTSGDGALDADELKVALRVALGVELSRDECVELTMAADKDGTGTVDFDEFRAICRAEL